MQNPNDISQIETAAAEFSPIQIEPTEQFHVPKLEPIEPIEHLHKALDGLPDDWDSPSPTQAPQPLRFSFSGSGKDYLSLWLTNWILTILTVGIYSAWAKVRRLQYIHQNTQLGGFAFGFHGEATKILVGRIIGIALIIASNLTNVFGIELAGTFTFLFFALFPWLYRSSIRFYSRNSSYRNVRFRFGNTSKSMYWLYFKSVLIVVFSAGFAFPYVVYKLRRYRIENSSWGNNQFKFTSTASAFFGIYILNIVVTILVVVGLVALSFALASPWIDDITKELANLDNETDQTKVLVVVGLYFLFIYAVYMLGRVLTQDMIFKESWNHIAIGRSRFSCDLSVVRLYFIRCGCFIASVLTLGLFIPYSHMIISKRRIESISVTPSHDFDVAQATLDDDTTRSAEVAGMFDIDIGW